MDRNPQLILRPTKIEVATINPTILLYRGVINEAEMEQLKNSLTPW